MANTPASAVCTILTGMVFMGITDSGTFGCFMFGATDNNYCRVLPKIKNDAGVAKPGQNCVQF